MSRITVVGSGASAVHFALTALERGHEVVMLDVGRPKPPAVLPDASWAGLKERLADPSEYFLGERFDAVLFPGKAGEYYGIPPSKDFVFTPVAAHRERTDGFAPLSSFAQGGLAEAWTGGSYPFNDAELAAFPFGYTDLQPHYARVAQRIGISGEWDDLSPFMPDFGEMLPPLDLDEHSRRLVETYGRRKATLNRDHRCFMGRSRVAVITRDRDGRGACRYLGRCLWGCPERAIYTPSMTLEACRRFGRFTYVDGVFVKHFTATDGGKVTSITTSSIATGDETTMTVDVLALGAGALSSCRIFLESLFRESGRVATLTGLMDNQQILMPFVNLSMLRHRYSPDSYQYHLLGLGLEGDRPEHYIHGQVTTLKTALIHPLVQNLPLNLKSSLAIFRNLHAALGLVNINLHDTRREENQLTIEPGRNGEPATLIVRYRVGEPERARIRESMRRMRGVLRELNCLVPPGMSHVRPMGASVHYAGLLPMTTESRPLTTTAAGQSRDFNNLFFVDGTTFPFLPAKNLTFTLMANATRIAATAF